MCQPNDTSLYLVLSTSSESCLDPLIHCGCHAWRRLARANGSPGKKHAAAAVRIRKVFVEKLAERNCLGREPVIADLPVCSRYGTGWTHTGCSGTPTPSRCSALIQGGKPYPGRMLTPEPLEPVNDWQTALPVVAHPDDIVFDRAAAVARWTSRASTSCTAR